MAVLATIAIAVLAAIGVSADAIAAGPHHHSDTRRCSTRRAHAKGGRCGRAARYRASHHRHTSARRNAPVQPLTDTSLATPSPTPETCVNTELTPTAANIAEVRAATLCLINRERIHDGEKALIENPHLQASAQGHSEDMVAGNYFSHTTPSGEAFDTRILATGYVSRSQPYELGENIDCATLYLATPAATVTAWMNSPDHRENILNGEYRESGVGIAAAAPASFAEGEAGATYTQDFGVIG
jgi:uncharacterized protein YkwD